MGTSNFYYKNTSKCFATLMSYEDDETGESVYPETFEIDDEKDNFIDSMKELFKNDFVKGGQDDRDRNFYGTALGRVIKDRDFMDKCIQIEVTAYLRSGYYDGACYDYEYTIHVDNYESDSIDNAIEDALYNPEYVGLMKANIGKLEKWLNDTLNGIINDLEGLFEQFSTPLQKIATFSNGETIYEKID